MVSGSCTVYGSFPTTTLDAGGEITQVDNSYFTDAFMGLSPTTSFRPTMSFGGAYGEPSGATPGNCTIDVSWTFPAPAPTNILGPTEVEIGQTVELDGTVAYASNYNWTVSGGCSIFGSAILPISSIEGIQAGLCTVTREACNNDNECTTDSHDISVVGLAMMTPIRYLLLD